MKVQSYFLLGLLGRVLVLGGDRPCSFVLTTVSFKATQAA